MNDRLSNGCLPYKEFTFLPVKIDMIEVKSNSRRTNWITYQAVLENNRLLLYSQGNSCCMKAFYLENVNITQNPSEMPTNSIKITNAQSNDQSKYIHLFNTDDANIWQSVLFMMFTLISSY